jgi:Tfp pilus assembly protein PilN
MIRINLIPSKKTKRRAGTGAQQLVFFVALILLAGGALYYWYTTVEDEIGDKTVASNGLKRELEKLREKDLRERLKQIDDLQKSRVGPVRLLAELSRRIPSRVWINSIEEKDHKLKMVGAGLSLDDIAEFKKGLRESGYFVNIKDLGQEDKPSPLPGLNFVEFKLECDTKYAI